MGKKVTRAMVIGVMLTLVVMLGVAAQEMPKAAIVTEKVSIGRHNLAIPQIHGLKDSSMQLSFNNLVKDTVKEYICQASYDYDPSQVSVWSAPADHVFQQGSITSFGVRLSTYIKGAAHPSNELKTFTVDSKNGRVYKLGDFFADKGYKEKLDKLVTAQLGQKPFPYFSMPSVSDDNTNFYLAEEGMVIYFQQGEIAAYACGLIECLIPYQDIADIISPDMLQKK